MNLNIAVIIATFCCLNAVAQTTKLTSLVPTYTTQRIGSVTLSHEPGGRKPQVGQRKFEYGINAASNSDIIYMLNGRYDKFEGWVGVESFGKPSETARVTFQVFADGNKVYDSGAMQVSTAAKQFSVNVRQVKELELIVKDALAGGDPTAKERSLLQVAWAEPVLTSGLPAARPDDAKTLYEIKGGENSVLRLDACGKITGYYNGKKNIRLLGGTVLNQCREIKLLGSKKLPSGGMTFTRLVEHQSGNRCEVTDRFIPTKNSIRWETEINGKGKPWSTTIISALKWPVQERTRFWTTWTHPDLKGPGVSNNDILKPYWEDPLQTRPFVNSSRWFGGNPTMLVPTSGDIFSIPIATVIEPEDASGFSWAQSPEDRLLYFKLITTDDGSMEYQRRLHRISDSKPVRFSTDLIAHRPDWRSGLNWMVNRYPQYFHPPAKIADEVGGAAAYSSWEGELEVEKLKKMAFKFNWKASFDFPYMGMFMPPVGNWKTFATSAEAAKDPSATVLYQGSTTSRNQMEGYSAKMKGYGFHVLNYFNVTEFGTRVKGPESVNPEIKEADLWKDGNNFLHRKISDGILYEQNGASEYYRSWGDAIIMDPAGTNYKKFILDQARRHIEYLPSSSGICIDRMDWLIYFNTRADDGYTWYENKPARSLLNSWKDLLNDLGPIFQTKNKAVFVNPILTMRLDLMKNTDGIYSEYNEMGPGLNSSVFLGVKKPVAAWTWNEYSLKPDPDFYLQRFLYLGVFPSAPFPDNNHEIKPGAFADYWYLKYGPLFNSILAKKWVLEPGVLSVPEGNARANIFEVKGGYAIPVVMAEKGLKKTKISIDPSGLQLGEQYQLEAVLPGNENPVQVSSLKDQTGRIVIDVPLTDGCAVIRLLRP